MGKDKMNLRALVTRRSLPMRKRSRDFFLTPSTGLFLFHFFVLAQWKRDEEVYCRDLMLTIQALGILCLYYTLEQRSE